MGRDAAGKFDLVQTPSEGEQLIVDRQKGLRHRLGCDDQVVDQCVALSEQI